MKQVDMLEQHFAFGEYSYVQSIADPSIVGCYLKSILKYMEEPLCSYELYPMYKVICECLPSSTVPHEGIIKSVSEVIIQSDSV